jgi:hypothetical protein
VNRKAGENGSISMAALAILIFMAAVAAGGILVLQASLSYGRRSSEKEAARIPLEKEADRVMAALTEDATPEADCPNDPVWESIKTPQEEGVEIQLEDLSSRLNPNWVQKAVFEKTRLGSILLSGDNADEIQQRREDKGFSLDIESEYKDLIREEALPKYFSAYGYANINVTDEFALRKLYALRTGDEAGSKVFHARVQQLLAERKILKPSQLQAFLGTDFDKLYPVVNAEPILNVHFVEPVVLTELISYAEWKIKRPEQTAQLLLDAREDTELTAQQLRKIINAAENNRIYQYLGTITWFWKITVSRGEARLECIVARLPSEAEEAPRFLIIEERYSS